LHLDHAAPICDLGVHPGASADGIVRSKHFVTEPVALAAGERIEAEDRRCHLWFCIEGAGEVEGADFRPGDVWLLEGRPEVRAKTASRFLRTYAP
jgi:hypothetical protein